MLLQVKLENSQLDDLATRNTEAIDNYKTIQSAAGLTQIEKALALQGASGLLNTIGTRQSQLQEQRTQDVQTVKQIQDIEMPAIITRGTATQTTAASKRAGYAVAILLGLIVGVLLALISYAAWPEGGRDAPDPPDAQSSASTFARVSAERRPRPGRRAPRRSSGQPLLVPAARR